MIRIRLSGFRVRWTYLDLHAKKVVALGRAQVMTRGLALAMKPIDTTTKSSSSWVFKMVRFIGKERESAAYD